MATQADGAGVVDPAQKTEQVAKKVHITADRQYVVG
jgi:hypothetical protein